MDIKNLYLIGTLNKPGHSRQLRDLFEADMLVNGASALLRGSGPCELSDLELAELSNPQRVITLVAVDLSSGKMIGHVCANLFTTFARGNGAHVDLVVTHPGFLGRGVGKSLMIALLQRVQAQWRVRSVTLTSAADREVARSMYTKLGFEPKGSDRFELMLESECWSPPGGQTEPPMFVFLNHTKIGDISAPDVREAVRQAWRGGIDPIELRPYQQR